MQRCARYLPASCPAPSEGMGAGEFLWRQNSPVAACEQVCREHGLWLHVDAAWGGAALLSRKLRHHMAGCEQADSLCWNPHKLLVGRSAWIHG